MTSPEPILFCWSGGKDSAMALHILLQQAESIGLPLHEVLIPPQCVNLIYEARMEHALRIFCDQGVRRVAFGDIFLEDLRVYREKNLARINMTALFPIWKRDTRELIREFQANRFRAIAACIDPKVLASSFAGRELDDSFFRDLPPNADPCGENGEFHTFVFDGPIFRRPIPVRAGEIVHRDGFVFCDLLPATQGAAK